MPHFGDGFLAAALQHFSYNSEQVIHTLLEGNLPSELKGLDPQMPLQAPSQTAGRAGKGAAQASSNGKKARVAQLHTYLHAASYNLTGYHVWMPCWEDQAPCLGCLKSTISALF